MNTKSTYPFLFLLLASILAACSAPAPASIATPVNPAASRRDFGDAIPAFAPIAASNSTADDPAVSRRDFGDAIPAFAPITASNSTADDPAAIVQGFWDAINAKNFDAAMAFVGDDVKITGMPFNGSEDKAKFAAFMSSGILTYKISDLRVGSDGTVTLNLKMYNSIGYIRGSGAAQFQVNNEGKIFLIKFPNAS
jgi:ketosteroid isomerase-like protein